MAAVEQHLRGGLYQNALRRRAVLLEGLGQVKVQLQGEFQVRQDQTAGSPSPTSRPTRPA